MDLADAVVGMIGHVEGAGPNRSTQGEPGRCVEGRVQGRAVCMAGAAATGERAGNTMPADDAHTMVEPIGDVDGTIRSDREC
jgi:hypothetical protein